MNNKQIEEALAKLEIAIVRLEVRSQAAVGAEIALLVLIGLLYLLTFFR